MKIGESVRLVDLFGDWSFLTKYLNTGKVGSENSANIADFS